MGDPFRRATEEVADRIMADICERWGDQLTPAVTLVLLEHLDGLLVEPTTG